MKPDSPGGGNGGGKGGNGGGKKNKDPVAADDYGSLTASSTLLLDVLANDYDPDGDTLTLVAVAQPSHGTATLTADGGIGYTGADGYVGSDSFTYTIDDDRGGQASATVYLTITAENSAPVAADDQASLLEDASIRLAVLANDYDADDDPLSITGLGTPVHGTVTLNSDGTVTYVPDANYSGGDSFTYRVSDGSGGTDTATVALTVTAVNDAPVAVDDSYRTTAGQTLTVTGVLANDFDVDGDALGVTAFDASSRYGGSVAIAGDGSLTYTPAAGFTGTDSFTYTVGDGNGGSDVGMVAVAVEAAADSGTVPYYVEALIIPDETKRLNSSDAYGTPVTVTYAFLDEVPDYYGSATSSLSETFQPFTPQQEEATRGALALLEGFTNLTFVEVASPYDATLTFGLKDWSGSNLGSGAYPNGTAVGTVDSDVWIDVDVAGNSFVPGTKGYYVLLHEIGHAIGLQHPSLPVMEDNRQYTVMDYTRHPTMSGDVTGYQIYDIAALQYLYGANKGDTSGNDVYAFRDLDGKIVTIRDGGGHDTLDLSAATYAVHADLRPGAFSTISGSGSNNVAIAFDTMIENVIGGAHADTLIGNSGDNVLTGGAGADIFGFGQDWGRDVIKDFRSGEDRLDFRDSGATSRDLAISSDGTDTQIVFGDDQVTLLGVKQVAQSDFYWDATV